MNDLFNSIFNNNRYALFAGDSYWQEGGWGQLRGFFNSAKSAECFYMKHADGYGRLAGTGSHDSWGEIVDMRKRRLIKII